MATRITGLIGRTAAVAGLAAMLAFAGGFAGTGAEQDHPTNFFERHPGPAGGQTGVDPFDPYAPVDLGTAVGGSLRLDGDIVPGMGADPETADPCSPQRCTAW